MIANDLGMENEEGYVRFATEPLPAGVRMGGLIGSRHADAFNNPGRAERRDAVPVKALRRANPRHEP